MQADRASGHRILRDAQKGSSNFFSTSLSSLDDANLRLDRCQVFRRRSSDSPWCHQLFHPYLHVHILHASSIWTAYAEISLVETVFDHYADRPIYYNIFPQFPDVIYQLQFPKTAFIPTCAQLRSIYIHVRIVLYK